MTDIPGNEPSYDYFVVFFMDGADRRFEYEVSRDTSECIRESLEDDDSGNLIFEAYRPAEQVVLNSRFIQLAHFRWRPREGGAHDTRRDDYPYRGDESNESEGSVGGKERTGAISFYFNGRELPIMLTAEDPQEVFDLLLAMETEAFPRCSFVDTDGEEAVLDLRKLICAEFPRELAIRGGAGPLLEVQGEM